MNLLNALWVSRLGGRAIVSVQDPVRLDRYSEPQPDIALFRPRADFYRERHPGPADVLLLIEVADTTTGAPAGEAYRDVRVFASGGTLTAAAFPDIEPAVDQIGG